MKRDWSGEPMACQGLARPIWATCHSFDSRRQKIPEYSLYAASSRITIVARQLTGRYPGEGRPTRTFEVKPGGLELCDDVLIYSRR